MIYIELMGGLGNQLFQIFCLLSYSFTHKLAFRIKANKSDTVSPLDMISKRPTYWNNFLKNLSSFIYYENIKLPAFKESEFPFTEIPYYQQDFRIV